jgi:lipopolysaccharide transport system permease protein
MSAGLTNKTLLRDQVFILVWRDFKLKYNSTALGFLWSFLVPGLQAVLYWAVFASVARFGIDNYLLYMISGMFMWHFFSSSVLISRKCFVGNSALIKKTSVNRALLVLSRILTEWLHLLLCIPLLLGIMYFYGVRPSWSLLTLPIVLLSIFFFTLGIAFIVATLNLYMRDLERILSVVVHALFFATPVFYKFGQARGHIGGFLEYNPVAYFILAWRDIFYVPAIHWNTLALISALSVLTTVVGYFVYKYREPDFAEKL